MRKFTRFLSILLLTSIICCAFISVGSVCYADEDVTVYENYNNFPVEIAYGNYNLQNGSIYRYISVTVDMSTDALSILSRMAALLGIYSEIEPMLKSVGYTLEMDPKGRIIAYRIYESATDLYLEYGIDGYYVDDSEPNPKDYSEKSFFFVDSYSYNTTVFDDVMTNSDSIFNYILNVTKEYGFDESDVLFTYRYGTPYKIVSSDANTIAKDADFRIYIHSFYMTADTCGREICLSQHSPNQLGWYVVALGFALVIASSVVIIAVAAKRRR